MEELKKQAPENISEDKIKEIFIKNNENVVDTLIELWNICEKKDNIDENKFKWNNIRDICNDHDKEMKKYVDVNKKTDTNGNTIIQYPKSNN
tara:strand:- start:3174 stop:3449 length:276 start_codon:yes stop_codon:yes gene_type:complete